MNILEKALLWVLYSSLIATIMTIFILAIKKLFKNYLSPRLQHVLWFLILIRLLLPISIGSPLDLIDIVSESYKNIIDYEKSDLSQSLTSNDSFKKDIKGDRADIISRLNDNSEANTKKMYEEDTLKSKFLKIEKLLYEFKEQEKDSIEKIIKISSYIWIIGFNTISIFVLSITLKFKNNTREFYKVNNPHIEHILEISKDKLDLSKNISIYCNSEFKSPFIYGVLNPRIYIPKYVLDMSTDQELLHIILHELAHYKRKDLLSNLLSILAISFHWFNPVIWFAMKKMRDDRELSCDGYVLEVLEDHESIEYGMTILNFSKVFFNSDYRNNLNLCFYESSTQIERRIMMIKHFKKGSYKLSTVSVILLTLVGSATLVGAEGNIVNSNISASVSQNVGKEDSEDFKLYSDKENLLFNTLDRASDFVDFEFKVPDYFPQETEFNGISFNREDNLVNIRFDNFEGIGVHFDFLTSKKDIIESLKNTRNDMIENVNTEKRKSGEHSETIVDYKEEPFSISNINGTNFTITTSSTGKPKDSKEVLNDARAERYFVWKEKDTWYAIQYDRSFGEVISFEDMEKIVASLKNSKDVFKDKYRTKNFFNIYDKKDLITAKEHLNFLPSFPLSISEDFIAISSQLYIFEHSEGEVSDQNEDIFLNTTYRQKSTLSLPTNSGRVPTIDFRQQKDGSSYEALEKNVESGIDDGGNLNNPLSSNESKRSKTSSLKVNNVKVLTFNMVNSYGPDDIVEHTYYLWKQNDIYYELIITGKVDNHEDILKSFIK
ncbi:beta-lactamase regulatory protein BlaR [Gottschalkia acidurici 9a]|uniref:Beta-lactamase regulatory protein BlaR n=1 Tax=Gottschalkia acidurici (strain ATCC 7906 / DSM 604 / BCRC 14475 / CIP 104303 / KCTC 5404 / NCIMB 10678 / 9a) TaxID=1128398 RepID=K0B3D9_GOTA9|nr:M56 family metallopeptidase [Gottschalkia acidurici]AFS79692.1 beta-lactamase regulatory protein BlaR [Gottschalkia acidurici 9a]